MLGNNFGLFGDATNAKLILEKMFRITSPEAKITAGTRNPYKTDSSEHLEYHKFNQKRGRMAGQIRMRVRYWKIIGASFDYLFVSPKEMRQMFTVTDWRIEEFIKPEETNYFAIIGKKSLYPGDIP